MLIVLLEEIKTSISSIDKFLFTILKASAQTQNWGRHFLLLSVMFLAEMMPFFIRGDTVAQFLQFSKRSISCDDLFTVTFLLLF